MKKQSSEVLNLTKQEVKDLFKTRIIGNPYHNKNRQEEEKKKVVQLGFSFILRGEQVSLLQE